MCRCAVDARHDCIIMSYSTASTATATTTTTTITTTAADAADNDDDAGKDSASPVTDATTAAAAGPKGMMEFFRRRCKSGGVNTGDPQAIAVCEASSSTDADSRSLAGEGTSTLDVHKEYGYYHTVSSSDARVLRAALAKERVPIFRQSDSKARRSTAGGAGVRFSYQKERITEGAMLQTDGQSLGSSRSDSKSFRDIFLRRRNRSDRSEQNPDISSEGKPKTGRVRMRNFLVSFRSRPRSVSVSYAPVDAVSSGTAASGAATPVQTVGKKKKFRVTPATLLPSLKRSEPPRIGPEDFVEMYCRSRTTSDPRSDAILKARVAANLHKVRTVAQGWMTQLLYLLLFPRPL